METPIEPNAVLVARTQYERAESEFLDLFYDPRSTQQSREKATLRMIACRDNWIMAQKANRATA